MQQALIEPNRDERMTLAVKHSELFELIQSSMQRAASLMTEPICKRKTPMDHVEGFMCKHKRMNPPTESPTVSNPPTAGTSNQPGKAPALVSETHRKVIKTKKAAAHTVSKKGKELLAPSVHPANHVETLRDNIGMQAARNTHLQRNRSQRPLTTGTVTT